MPTQGNLYIFSAPSGAGKTSLVKALLQNTSELVVSVSHTTRACRSGEADGVHYHFVDLEVFERMVKEDAFVEYAKVFDNYYGTAKSALLAQLQTGQDVILEIDWQGARQIRAWHPQAIGVFILPPSRTALAQRLADRQTDSQDVIARRMQAAVAEMRHYDEYDYLVVNDDFATALNELRAIVMAQRLCLPRQREFHSGLLAGLLAE